MNYVWCHLSRYFAVLAMLIYWHRFNWQCERRSYKETINARWMYTGLLSLSGATELLTTQDCFNLGLKWNKTSINDRGRETEVMGRKWTQYLIEWARTYRAWSANEVQIENKMMSSLRKNSVFSEDELLKLTVPASNKNYSNFITN